MRARSITLLAVALLGAGCLSRGRAPEPAGPSVPHAFPIHAQDLAPDERISTWPHVPGIQRLGQDLNIVHWVHGMAWTGLRAGAPADPALRRNEDSIGYGRPFHAIDDGEVLGCWRNAPENPVPGDLHPMFKAHLIPGAGNHLWIRHSDGVALYAHAIPGSIPAELCPNDDELLASTQEFGSGEDPDISPGARLSAFGRPRVRRGQLLGRIGNSGSSGGPHLHLHMEASSGGNSVPHPMAWEAGVASPIVDGRADLNRWIRFAGGPLPAQPILVWPGAPFVVEEIHAGVAARDFGALFDRVTAKGYQADTIDLYEVDGQPYLNTVWHPVWASGWSLWFQADVAFYEGKLAQARRDGYEPLQLDTLPAGNTLRYSVIFVKQRTPRPWLERHDLDEGEHQQVMAEARRQGLSPASLSVVSVGGRRRHTVLYRAEDLGDWQLETRVPESAYPRVVEEHRRAGRRLAAVNAYREGPRLFYALIFANKVPSNWIDRAGLGRADYAEAVAASRGVRLTHALAGLDGSHRYAVVWSDEGSPRH
ncbi:MAG TPA: hypothetical protein VN914_02555 [Polyangia bacterium]|nr:hypothetical protein [Polyangia bacterium]